MGKYKILKILSNNVVLVKKDTQNYILIGRGIGFSRKKGDVLNNNKNIENTFISLNSMNHNEYDNLISSIDPNIIEITNDIINLVLKETHHNLNPNFHLGLIDHINFAIKRLKEGIEIINPFLSETKLLYPKEYKLAEKAVDILGKKLDMNIPEAEIGFITFHIYGAINDKSKNEAFKNSKTIKKIVEYVNKKMNLSLDKESFNYIRFVNHLLGVINRVKENKHIENIFLDNVKSDISYEFKLAYDISKIIENDLNVKVSEEELGFIALHLYKLKI